MRAILLVLMAMASSLMWLSSVHADIRVDSGPIAAAADQDSGEKKEGAGGGDAEPECD